MQYSSSPESSPAVTPSGSLYDHSLPLVEGDHQYNYHRVHPALDYDYGPGSSYERKFGSSYDPGFDPNLVACSASCGSSYASFDDTLAPYSDLSLDLILTPEQVAVCDVMVAHLSREEFEQLMGDYAALLSNSASNSTECSVMQLEDDMPTWYGEAASESPLCEPLPQQQHSLYPDTITPIPTIIHQPQPRRPVQFIERTGIPKRDDEKLYQPSVIDLMCQPYAPFWPQF